MKKTKQKNPLRPVKTGVYSWLKTGRINPSIRGYKKLQKYLQDIEHDLVEMQGGPGKLTAAKEILIKSVVEAYGVLFLSSMYVKKHGILRPDMMKKGVIELQPVLGKQFIAFMNTIRQGLLALGLDGPEADKMLDIKDYLELKVEKPEKQPDGNEKTTGEQP